MTPVRPSHPSWRGRRSPVRRLPVAAVAVRRGPDPASRTMPARFRPSPPVGPEPPVGPAPSVVTPEEHAPRALPPRRPSLDPHLEGTARELFDLAPVAMQVADADGYFLYVNPATPRVFGVAAEDLVGMHVSQLTHPDEQGEDRELFQRVVAGEIPRYSVRKRYVTGFGEVIWALTTVTRFPAGADGRPRLLGQVQNLTNVPGFTPPDVVPDASRREVRAVDVSAWETSAFRAAIERQLSRCRDHGEHAGLLVFDIEPRDPRLRSLPQFAPTEQHEAMGQVIRGRLKGADIVGRLDRRRFAVVQPYADLAEATETARDLVADITRVPDELPLGVPVRLSAAVATLDPSDVSAEVVLNRVTFALLQEGRDGHVVVQVPR